MFSAPDEAEQLKKWEAQYKNELKDGRSPEEFGLQLLALEIQSLKEKLGGADCR